MALTALLLVLGLSQLPALATASHNNLTVYTEPNHVRPYVIPYLRGYAVQAFGYVLRFPVTNVSTEGALSLLQLNGQATPGVPVHIHTRYHETFFVSKGAVNLYVQNETRRLGPLDIASVPPNTNHSFELLEPDTEILGLVTPGGFSFYQAVGDTYAPPTLAEFPTGDAVPYAIEAKRVANATGLYYDYNPTNYNLNHNLTNGTTNPHEPWHNGNNSLPGTLTPYFVAGGWGPKFLHRGLGQVVHLYMTGAESDNNITIATLTMRAARSNETCREFVSSSAAQIFKVLEGSMKIRMQGGTVALGTGDLAVVPRGVRFGFWSEVAFTRVYVAAARVPGAERVEGAFGVVGDLVREAEEWGYAIFPDYY